MRRQRDSPKARFGDPNYPFKRRKADIEAVRSFVSRNLGLSLGAILDGHIPLQALQISRSQGQDLDLYSICSICFFSTFMHHPAATLLLIRVHAGSSTASRASEAPGQHFDASQQAVPLAELVEDQQLSPELTGVDAVPIIGLQSFTEADIAAESSLQPGSHGEASAHDSKPIIGLMPPAPLDDSGQNSAEASAEHLDVPTLQDLPEPSGRS